MSSYIDQHRLGRRLKRTMIRIGVGTGVTALCLVPFSLPAVAGAPQPAIGGFAFASDVQIPTRFPGSNVVISEVATLAYTGDLVGEATDTDVFVAHADGSFEGHGTEVCDPCTLWNHTGSFTSQFTFSGVGDSYIGHMTILTSSGGLVGLHGTGMFAGQIAENTNTYAYLLQLG